MLPANIRSLAQYHCSGTIFAERERERLARSLSIIFQNLYIAVTLFLTMLRFFCSLSNHKI